MATRVATRGGRAVALRRGRPSNPNHLRLAPLVSVRAARVRRLRLRSAPHLTETTRPSSRTSMSSSSRKEISRHTPSASTARRTTTTRCVHSPGRPTPKSWPPTTRGPATTARSCRSSPHRQIRFSRSTAPLITPSRATPWIWPFRSCSISQRSRRRRSIAPCSRTRSPSAHQSGGRTIAASPSSTTSAVTRPTQSSRSTRRPARRVL